MATLVLSTVGTALGGPAGSAIGALIGQSIDQQLLAPPRRGPRVGDLAVQTSSYGTQIPRIYGTMRLAGSVIWSTDLIEHELSGGAKGGPDVSYGYTVSMAVALSSRRARAIKRIWADGKLLRGAEGDLKVGGTLRFHDGDEDQPIDPLIASIESIESTPAYRGLAIAVFEDLELGEYGNRIPFMTFEVEADEEAPSLGWLISDATNGIVQGSDARALQGYAAYGRSIGSAIEPVTECFGVELFDDGENLRSGSGSISNIIDDELGCTADQVQASRIRREQVATRQLPAVLRLTYYDASRDFQTSEARASAGETDAGTEVQRELPAVIDAGTAKALAQAMISRDWLERDVLTLRMPPHRIALEPGSRLVLPLGPNLWTVRKVVVDGMAVIVTVKPCGGATGSVAADGGRITPNGDVIGGEVSIALLDIPALSPNNPTLLLAASSPAAAWKRVPVEVAFAGQNMTVRTSARKSSLGSALTILPPADPSVIDMVSSIDVQMVDPEQWLTSCDDEALAAGANLALVGHELLQFADVTPLGGGRFRLAKLLRGRAGTEGVIPDHAAGEIFCVVETSSLQSITLPVSAIGMQVTAQTAGSSASLIVSPRADAIASPSGGATVDEEARSSINLILATMRQHGLIDV